MTARASTPQSSAPDTVLLVDALSIVRRGLPGPALGGRTGIVIVASVTYGDGTPATALGTQAFELYAASSAVTSSADAMRVRTARETIPGIYTLHLETMLGSGVEHECQVFALMVHEAGGGNRQGRALLRVDL